MIISRVKDQIILTAEDTFDWMELFDCGLENEIMFEVDGDNLEFFCPGWETHIDQDKPFDSLRIDDVKQIKSLHILLAPNIDDMGGWKPVTNRSAIVKLYGGKMNLLLHPS